MSKLLKLFILTSAFVSLTNCSGGSVSTGSSATPGTNNGQSTGNNGTPTPSPIDNVDLKGTVDDSNKSFLTFDFDKTTGQFIVMIPLPSGFVFSPTGSFNRYPDITFRPVMDATGKMKFGVFIPIKYVIKGSSLGQPTTLPNGDHLPAMPAGLGEMPSLALNFPAQNNTQITLYLGVNALGLFVTLPDNIAIPIGFQIPVRNKDKTKTFGYLTYVPKKAGYPPGLFMSTIIPPATARILEDYFHL